MGNSNSSSGFSGSSTSTQVLKGIDLAKKHAFITGCNTGIGKETVKELYRNGCYITMACRNKAKMNKAKLAIENEVKNSNGKIRTMDLDLSSLESVKSCANSYKNSNDPDPTWNEIDMLILNAGVMGCPFTKSKDGMEMQLAVNHFGHYALTNLLLDKMKDDGRIVVVSSLAHKFSGTVDLDDLNYEKKKYSKWSSYGRSKIANIWFTRELAKRLENSKKTITVNALHPGWIRTELDRHMNSGEMILQYVGAPFQKSIPQGASTTCYVATNPKIKGVSGKYFSNCNIAEPTAYAQDDKLSSKLWKLSEQFTKINYPF